MHTLCRLHGPFSAEVYKYSTRKHLHVHFLFFSLFFFLLLEYAVLYAGVYRNIISLLAIVRAISHVLLAE